MSNNELSLKIASYIGGINMLKVLLEYDPLSLTAKQRSILNTMCHVCKDEMALLKEELYNA